MSDHIKTRGVVRDLVESMKNYTGTGFSFYELIDDRHHSKSNKVFIHFDGPSNSCKIGYSEYATEKQIASLVEWFSSNKDHKKSDCIAARGIGSKFFTFSFPGNWKYISYSEEKKRYFHTESSTSTKLEYLYDPETTDSSYTRKFNDSSWNLKYEKCLPRNHEDVFLNTNDIYPFKPKTLFYGDDLDLSKLFTNNYTSNEEDDDTYKYNYDTLINDLKKKYYHEIKDCLELYIKLPGSENFMHITTDNSVDLIGSTQKEQELSLDFFIDKNEHLGHTIKCYNKYYKFKSNGNSVLRVVSENQKTDPDFRFYQYKNPLDLKESKRCMNDNGFEKNHMGLYIQCGNTFISPNKIECSSITRNIEGNKSYRCILKPLTDRAKKSIGLQGIKSSLNINSNNNMCLVIRQCCAIYKRFCQLSITPENIQVDSEPFVIVKSSNKKKVSTKPITGELYIIALGVDSEAKDNIFFKFGYVEKAANVIKRYHNMNDKKKRKILDDFHDIELFERAYIAYQTLSGIEGPKELEARISSYINNSPQYNVYHNKNGNDIREYFTCKDTNLRTLINWIQNQ